MSKKFGAYLVTFNDGEKYIFGNNYKPWWQHAVEFIYRFKGDRALIKERGWQYKFVTTEIASVKYSEWPFYDDGGLKWCPLDEYQSVINDVCREQNAKPIDAQTLVFNNSQADKTVLTKKLKEY